MQNFPQFYNKIFDYSLKRITHIKFKHLLKPTTLAISTKHIYNEMPIRFAQRVTELNNLPFGLSKNHSVNTIREWYLTSFLELTNIEEPKTDEDIRNFKNIIENIYKRHSHTVLTMSKGIYELKKENKINDVEAPQIQTFLNCFYTNRTKLRILIEQYLALYENKTIIDYKCNPKYIIMQAIEDIQYICNNNYIDIELKHIIKINCPNDLTLPSIDYYLYYIFMELLKNSINAIIHRENPNIIIDIIDIDNKYILIKIGDNGIGIKENDLEKIWYYSFSTSEIDSSDFNKSPLSGFGYGLPLTEIYINFFNSSKNNIKIDSIYNEGTDVYIYLRKYSVF